VDKHDAGAERDTHRRRSRHVVQYEILTRVVPCGTFIAGMTTVAPACTSLTESLPPIRILKF
jgi:hypothetical protein